MLRLGLAQGGSPGMEMIDGLPRPRFMGFPVVFNNVVNTAWTDAANTIDAYFGDFSRSVVTGDRMSFEFDTNESVYFNSYAVGVRGVERYHTVVHDVGAASAALGGPGPVVCLIQS
jgi:HK97 family phage major capsid protein